MIWQAVFPPNQRKVGWGHPARDLRKVWCSMLLMILTFFPFIFVFPAWWFYQKEAYVLVSWRRAAFVLGIVANAVSAVVIISFTIHAYVVSRGTIPVDLDRIYPVFSMLGIGLLATGLAFFGRKISRLILIGNGLLTAVLWYFVALAASP